MPPHFDAEAAMWAKGFRLVAGVDEAGRGPLAGPVAAAAVILDPCDPPADIDDSKVVPAPRRVELYEFILARAQAVGVGFASVAEIERINIRQATFAAMRRAVAALAARPCYALVDGNDHPPMLPCPGHAIVKGDSSSFSIAAASIVAKVARDRLMERLGREHPHYGFADHKGYATAAHRAALALHGPSPFHRSAFFSVREAAAAAGSATPAQA